MKTVFNNEMCAHVWAQQTQAYGRSSTMFFEHGTLYSYGHHYLIAEFRVVPSGAVCVMFNATKSSATTERHKAHARHAIRDGVQIFTLPGDCWDDSERALAYYDERIEQAYAQARRARTNASWRLEEATELTGERNTYTSLFQVDAPTLSLPRDIEALRERANAQLLAYREARKPESNRDRLRDTHAGYVRWRAGKRKECPAPWRSAMSTHRLTYCEASDTVYTSRGASFPGEHARRAALPLLAALDRGAELNQTLRLGHFQIDAIEPDIIRAGCHRVTRREARRMVRRLIGA